MSSQLQRIGIKRGLFYEGPNPRTFKTLIASIGEIVNEVTLYFDKTGIRISEYPQSGTVIVNVHIDTVKWEHAFEILGGEQYALPFEAHQLVKYLSVLNNDHPFMLIYNFDDVTTPCLQLQSLDPAGGRTGTGRATILNERSPEEMNLDMPQIAKIQLPANQFANVVNNIITISGQGQRGEMELRLSIGGEEDYVELEAIDENDPTNGWTERFKSQVTNLKNVQEMVDRVIDEPVTVDSTDDLCDEKSYEMISRQDDLRPAKRQRFERIGGATEPIIFKKRYGTNYLKSIAKLVGLVDTVDLVFLSNDGQVVWMIQLNVPNFGVVKFCLSEKEDLDD